MSIPSHPLRDNAKFLKDVSGTETLRVIAARWGCSFGFVQSMRKTTPVAIEGTAKPESAFPPETTEEFSDGTRSVSAFEAIRDRPVTLDDAREWLESSGDSTADFNIAVKSIAYGGDLFSNKMSAWPKNKKEKAANESVVVFDSLLDSIKGFTYIPEPVAYAPESAIIVPADLQVGKVDWQGGSKETAAQSLNSFYEFAEFCKEFRPQEIVMVDAGDPVENVFNTSSQMGTNDLDLPHQIAAASRIFLEGIKLFAPLAPKVSFKAVSSNHGAFRTGPKAPAGDAHADFGIVIAEMLRDSLSLNEASFGHATVQTPEPYMESLYFQTSGSDMGVVHGHQAGSADKIGEWWRGQSHGQLPVGKARILIAGHFHSLRVYQSGDGRWVMVGPSSDRGSTWFTNIKGESSESGMLSFTTADNVWSNLAIR